MAHTPSIPFPAALDCLVEPGLADGLSPVELGVLHRMLEAAWRSDPPGTLPDPDRDVHTFARRCRLTEPDLVHARAVLALAGARDGSGRIVFAILAEAAHRLASSRAHTREAKARAARARWDCPPHQPSPPPRGGCFGDARASAGALRLHPAPSLSPDPSGDERSSAEPEEKKKRLSAGSLEVFGSGAPARAPDPGSYAVDLSGLSAADQLEESQRRALVYRRLREACFAEASSRQIPEDVAQRISLAPWVTEEISAFAVWEASDLVKSYAARGKTFNPVGHVIATCGTSSRTWRRPRQPSITFEPVWRSVRLVRERQAAARSALMAKKDEGQGVRREA